MSPQAGWNAPTSSITRSNGPSRSRIASYSVVRPGVAAEEHRVPLASGSTSDDHSVALRSFRPRPEKCCDGAAVTVSPAFGSRCDSHQSSSMMRSGRTPQASRCAPTPSEVTNGTSRFASSRMVG